MPENETESAQTEGIQTAIAGLQYLAGDAEQLSRFCALTGVEPGDIRGLIGETAFQVGILDFFLGHEPTLLAFTAHAGIDPQQLAKIRHRLAGPQGLGTADGAEWGA